MVTTAKFSKARWSGYDVRSVSELLARVESDLSQAEFSEQYRHSLLGLLRSAEFWESRSNAYEAGEVNDFLHRLARRIEVESVVG